MSISFKYTILSVDVNARCMEVLYEAAGHKTMHIGTRIPFEGESLEDVIRMFAPIPLWIAEVTPVVAPQVGTSATLEPVVGLPEEPTDTGEEVLPAPSEQLPVA